MVRPVTDLPWWRERKRRAMANTPTGYNACIREILDLAKTEKGLTQDAIAEAIGVHRVALNRSAKAERTLGHEAIAKLLKICAVDERLARRTWAEFALDVMTRSRFGACFTPIVDACRASVPPAEFQRLLLESARNYIRADGGRPNF